MLLSSKESLEDKIIRYLINKERTVKSIKKTLENEGKEATIQGIYKALRVLVAQEIVIKRGSWYSISEEWRSRVVHTLSHSNNRFELVEGERITLDLSSLVHLDQQWKNIVLPLHDLRPTAPVFFYNAHEIWMHLSESRKESELTYYASFKTNKTYAFCLIGGNTVHDAQFKKDLQHEYMQVAIGIEHFSKTDYPTIFDDYVITTRMSHTLSEKIEQCYRVSRTELELKEKLHAIGIEKKKVRLIIERNTDKAKKLRKKLSKEFFVPKQLIEEFELY